MKSIIAGPCSAESEAQILTIAHFLAQETPVRMLRAGVWKPRTRPGEFEGVGNIALQWLKKAKIATGLKIAVEIARAEHVESCLDAGIDCVWIGARTTVNPFSVQEIADALRGTSLPVMVKNPLNPDLGLWIGALERIEKAGITDIVAVHRGFSVYQQSPFRNPPMWPLPIELKRRCPDLKIYCDPSHICGKADLIPGIAQRCLDMEMDGLMLEVHPHPQNALTDKQQQLDFRAFKQLLDQLVEPESTNEHKPLDQYRMLIDEIDEDLLHLVSKRMEIVKTLGEYKREHKMSILQMDRWKSLLENRLKMSRSLGLEDEFIVELLRIIQAEAIRLQVKNND